MWNRGIVFGNDCVAQSTFQDLGNPNKSVDIRGAPVYGVYQASPTTVNYFAGKTGIGALPPATNALAGDGADDAVLHVGGSMRINGRISRHMPNCFAGSEHSAVLSPGAREQVILNGIATLDAAGTSEVVAVREPHGLDAVTVGGQAYTYHLTALGTAMPTLHVSTEAALSSKGLSFTVAGGAPRGRVSWQLTAYASHH
jgi:hypothetical protein